MSFAVPITRREAVLRQLRDEIVSGTLRSGSVIKDAEIAARLGVSITPVREAIAQLAAEGMIDIAPNRTRHVTRMTQRSAIELADVMTVLACAGFEWGLPNLSAPQKAALHVRLDEFTQALQRRDVTAAAAAGSDVSTIVISASGNRELQTHVDLVVHRSLRLLALTPESDIWTVWLEGYREVIAAIDADDLDGALRRYRQIYVEYRRCIERMLFEESDQV